MNEICPSSPGETLMPAGVYYCPECNDAVIRYHTPIKKFKLNCPKCNTEMKLSPPSAVETFELLGGKIQTYSKASISEYIKRGVKPPNGKGVHTRKFHEMSAAIMKDGKSRSAAAAITMSKLGSKGGVKKSHQKKKYAADARRMGKPRTEEERKKRHKKLQPKTKLLVRGTGLKTSKPLTSLPPYRAFATKEQILHFDFKSAITGWRLGLQHGAAEAEGKRSSPGAIRLGILKIMHGEGYILGRQHALAKAGMHGGAMSDRNWADVLTDFMKEVQEKPKPNVKIA